MTPREMFDSALRAIPGDAIVPAGIFVAAYRLRDLIPDDEDCGRLPDEAPRPRSSRRKWRASEDAALARFVDSDRPWDEWAAANPDSHRTADAARMRWLDHEDDIRALQRAAETLL
jgi:hypothetical protein